MPSEFSVKRTCKILLGSLKIYLIKVMRGGVPNMNLLTIALPSNTACKVYDES